MLKRLFILMVFILPFELQAQVYPFRTYSIEQGLSESVVYDMVQDNNGFMWFATGYGLNRFDGIEFITYFEEEGLNNSRIESLYKDRDGIIWIGTASGVNYLEEDSIKSVEVLEALRNSAVISILQDSAGDFWFGTDNEGVWHYSPDDKFLIQYSTSNGFGGNSVRAIKESPNGSIWFGTRDGITILNDGNFRTFTQADGLPDNRIWDISFDESETVWIGSRGGLVSYKNNEITIYQKKDGLINNQVRTITTSSDGLWIGTEEGISFYNGTEFENYPAESGLSNQMVISSVTDREGNMWFGTYGGGTNLFLGRYFENFSIEQGLPNNLVTSFTEFRGRIWIGMYGGGVTSLDEQSFDDMGINSYLPDNQVYKIMTDSRNRMWIGMRDGLAVVDDEDVFVFDDADFYFRRVRDIMETREGNYWISTYENGIVFYDGDTFQQYTTENGLINNTVLNSVEGDDGSVWIATYGGVSRFKEGEFQGFAIQEGLPNNGVMNIMKDMAGTIWVSTFGGIAWFDGLQFRSITTENGLPDRVGYFIQQSSDGIYWIGSTSGVFRFNAGIYFDENVQNKNQAFQLLTKDQGLIANELNLGAVFEDAAGHFWFGSVEGMSHFDPKEYRGNLVPPKVHISNMIASGRVRNFNEHIKLSHDQNFIEFYYSGINFTAPGQIIYEYRLKDIDPDWHQTKSRYVSYPSLPPGEYEFQVRAGNANNTWSEEIKAARFSISAPYWQQPWFLLFLALVIVGIIVLIYNYYRIRKMVDIERMRVRIASDLHDDVGASLTEVALQSDFLQSGVGDEEIRTSLEQIGKQCRRIVTSLDDIVWSIDARNDTLGDLTDRMQDYVLNTLEQRNFSVHYNFENLNMENKLSVSLKENLYLIFKEAVNNIAKYSNGDMVEITLTTAHEYFEMEIFDNGTTGKGKKKTGQGLRNMKLRADRIGADIKIVSDMGYRISVKGKLNVN